MVCPEEELAGIFQEQTGEGYLLVEGAQDNELAFKNAFTSETRY